MYDAYIIYDREFTGCAQKPKGSGILFYQRFFGKHGCQALMVPGILRSKRFPPSLSMIAKAWFGFDIQIQTYLVWFALFPIY